MPAKKPEMRRAGFYKTSAGPRDRALHAPLLASLKKAWPGSDARKAAVSRLQVMAGLTAAEADKLVA